MHMIPFCCCTSLASRDTQVLVFLDAAAEEVCGDSCATHGWSGRCRWDVVGSCLGCCFGGGMERWRWVVELSYWWMRS
jgi:hypothetical protein